MMTMGSAWAWWVMPPRFGWLPALVCAAVAAWMWSLPTAAHAVSDPSGFDLGLCCPGTLRD